MTDLHAFYLTFGVKYYYQPHPFWEGADPAGWVRIMARDEPEARHVAKLYFDRHWSMLYPANHFPEELNKAKYYPKGEIAVIEVGEYPPKVGGPVPRFSNSEPQFYGVDPSEVVAVRIEGKPVPDGPADCGGYASELGYDAEHFHPKCAEEGAKLFEEITERDDAVLASELDWSIPYHCEVCQESIT